MKNEGNDINKAKIGSYWDRRCVGMIDGHILNAKEVVFDGVEIKSGTMYSYEMNVALHGPV